MLCVEPRLRLAQPWHWPLLHWQPSRQVCLVWGLVGLWPGSPVPQVLPGVEVPGSRGFQLLPYTVILPESAGPTCANNCPFERTGPLRTKSRWEVPLHFTPGWHSGDAGVCLWAVHGAWSNGAAGVRSCGILRRLVWRWGVVSYG